MTLGQHELRVLGALIEKEITTPDLYPLSLNSLQSAANQRSSRDPVLDLSEDDLRAALHQLEDRGLASPARGSLNAPVGRVPRFEHHARTIFQLRRDETAILCLLLLRGPQTPGELRSRADRLFTFDDLPAVISTLDRLAAADAGPHRPLVAILPRQPGSRESRYTHLLGDPADVPTAAPSTSSARQPASDSSVLESLEAKVADLERRLALLEATQNPQA